GPPRPLHAGVAAGEPVRRSRGAGGRARHRHPAKPRGAGREHRGTAKVRRMSDSGKMKPGTAVAHLGRNPRQHLGAVNTPVYRASTILFDSVAELEAAMRGDYPGMTYGLHGLPTVEDLQRAVTGLEGGYAALAVASGLAAITLALLGATRAGDHVLVTDSVYGPTRRFCDN